MRGESILLKIAPRVFGAITHIRVCRHVEHKLSTHHRLGKARLVQNIPAHQAKAGGPGRGSQKALLPGGEIVVANHRMAVRKKPLGQCTTDEAGATGNEITQLGFQWLLEADND